MLRTVQAANTAPAQVYISNATNDKKEKHVYAKYSLPARIRFGPLQGKILPISQWNKNSWLVRNSQTALNVLTLFTF